MGTPPVKSPPPPGGGVGTPMGTPTLCHPALGGRATPVRRGGSAPLTTCGGGECIHGEHSNGHPEPLWF